MEARGGALVTGASRGIGRAVAIELARRGFDVVATMRDPTAGAELASALPAGSPGTLAVAALDVTDPGDFAVPDGLRVLVNNAGLDGPNRSVEDTPVDEWRALFETNVFGVVDVTRRAIPVLRASGGGVLVNVLSSSVVVPMPLYSTYRASKAAVQALSESLRAEVAPFRISVMDVLPGPVDTDMLARSRTGDPDRHSEPYRSLAKRIDSLRTSEPSTPVEEAATTIVDALLAEPPPHRMACDPMGADMLAGWATTPDAEWQRNFLAVFGA